MSPRVDQVTHHETAAGLGGFLWEKISYRWTNNLNVRVYCILKGEVLLRETFLRVPIKCPKN
jgi:hypothetical protein